MMRNETKSAGAGVLKNAAAGCVSGVAAMVLIVFICAVLISRGVLPPGLETYLVLAALFVGSLLAGHGAARRQGSGMLTAGAAAGAVLLVLLLVLTALLPETRLFSAATIKRAVSVLAGAVCGGLLYTGGKKHKKRR